MIYKTVTELIKLIQKKEVSSVEILDSLLKRINDKNPQINAVVALDADRSIEKAKKADELTMQGKSLGPLHGIPMTIKDAYEVEGLVSTGGDPDWKNNIPKKNAEAVQRLVNAGSIIFGKTNVHYHSADIQSYN